MDAFKRDVLRPFRKNWKFQPYRSMLKLFQARNANPLQKHSHTPAKRLRTGVHGTVKEGQKAGQIQYGTFRKFV
jgi:hypothetical protein